MARDRFGVKPLYLAESPDALGFASEIKALRALPWVSGDPQLDAVRAYLTDASLDRGKRTFFNDVECFPAAHSLLISPGGRRLAVLLACAAALSRCVVSCATQRRRPGRGVPLAPDRLRRSAIAVRRPDRVMFIGRNGQLVDREYRRRTAVERHPRAGPRTQGARGQSATCILRPVPRSRHRRAPIRRRRGCGHGSDPPHDHSGHEPVPRVAARNFACPGRAVRIDQHRRPVPRDANCARGRSQGAARRAGRRRAAGRLHAIHRHAFR